jgi:hypothetical protein
MIGPVIHRSVWPERKSIGKDVTGLAQRVAKRID